MFGRNSFQTKIAVAVTTSLICLIAGIGWLIGGIAGMEFAGVVTSGVLTAALVGLYFQQTTLLEDQIDLRAQELNREIRQNHTETLRKRIYAWLGQEDVPRTIDSISDIFESSERRLPNVTAVDVEPPEDSIYTNHSPEDFRVVPFGLEEDSYFTDLMENHAPGLKEKKETIEDRYSKFANLRSQFETGFEGSSFHRDSFSVEPDVHLSRWVFETIVKVERNRSDEWDEELVPVVEGFEDRNNPTRADGEIRFFQGSMDRRSIYCVIPDKGTIDEVSDDEARSLAIEALEDTINKIDLEQQPYQDASRAAELLDTLEDDIQDLRMELIEYAGRPIFPGHCKYLEEAAIEGTESVNRTD